MDIINSIPLNGTITAFTPTGAVDAFNKPASYTKTTHDSAIFRKTKLDRDNYKRDILYEFVVYVKDVVVKEALIFIGTTTATDPDTIAAKEIKDFSEMEDVFQNIVGYKIWL